MDLNRLRFRGLEIAVHMALIREVKSEPKRNRRHIVVRTVLISFGLEIAQLSICIYRYRENHDAKNVITGEYKEEGVFN